MTTDKINIKSNESDCHLCNSVTDNFNNCISPRWRTLWDPTPGFEASLRRKKMSKELVDGSVEEAPEASTEEGEEEEEG